MRKKWRNRILGIICLAGLFLFYVSLPDSLFDEPYSTVLVDRNGELLGASIARDGQWRFPATEVSSDKFKQALIYFEDEYFNRHPGVNPVSTFRALKQNINSGKVVSGGSTITMQVMRLSRRKPRTWGEKIVEMILAVRLELRYSKQEILNLYMSHAPFGGNVVGIEAASWRYFHRDAADLSWGEASLLAVLPNNPSMIHPGRNRSLLKAKRDLLLDKLTSKGIIDSLTCVLSKSEAIPEQPQPLPRTAPHLLQKAIRDGHEGTIVQTTIEFKEQQRVNRSLERAYNQLKANEVNNAAALIAEVKTGKVIAYVGNISSGEEHGMDVDIIQAPRSTGSLLKPFLYAAMINEGLMYPRELVPDIPVYIDGFNPKNFTGEYDGAVKADAALARSLNVPAIQLLKKYRYEKFHSLLTELGMTTLQNGADHYGLSLILGGSEGTLWELSQMYSQLSFTVSNSPGTSSPVLRYFKNEENRVGISYPIDRGALWHTVNALSEVKRPDEEGGWQQFSSTSKIAWKTGTSFGHRDGWAIGITPEYVVGVWTGNADGEGRPGLTGLKTAAPILFDIYSGLSDLSWYSAPAGELREIAICSQSGQRASENCTSTENVLVFQKSEQLLSCQYHKSIHLSKEGTHRVTSACAPIDEMVAASWFTLPPVQEYYYRKKHPEYSPLPPMAITCNDQDPFLPMEFIYPDEGSRIFIPKDLDGTPQKLILEVAHRDSKARIFWHIDEHFEGVTYASHKLAINPSSGWHTLTLIDEKGQILKRNIQFLAR